MSQNDNHHNLYDSGVNAFINKDYALSIDKFTRAIEKGDMSYHVWVSRGAAYLQSNQVHHAVRDFDHAISIHPAKARAYHMRALAHDKLGNSKAALKDLDRAIDLDPEYGAAFRSRAMVMDKIGRRDDAVEDMRMATHLTELRLAEFNNENNVWQSHHLKMEGDGVVSEFDR